MQAAYPSPTDFLATKSRDEKVQMMAWGASHVEELDAAGSLAALDGLRWARPREALLAE